MSFVGFSTENSTLYNAEREYCNVGKVHALSNTAINLTCAVHYFVNSFFSWTFVNWLRFYAPKIEDRWWGIGVGLYCV